MSSDTSINKVNINIFKPFSDLPEKLVDPRSLDRIVLGYRNGKIKKIEHAQLEVRILYHEIANTLSVISMTIRGLQMGFIKGANKAKLIPTGKVNYLEIVQGKINDVIEKIKSIHLEVKEKTEDFSYVKKWLHDLSDIRDSLEAVYQYDLPFLIHDLSTSIVDFAKHDKQMIVTVGNRFHFHMKRSITLLERCINSIKGKDGKQELRLIKLGDYIENIFAEGVYSDRIAPVIIREYEPGSMIKIECDRFFQVIDNLLRNANEAMDYKDKVLVRVRSLKDRVIFEFVDNGCGIPEENLAKIFDLGFTHGKEHGRGIGLNLVQQIVRDHRGKISVRNNKDIPGLPNGEKGATFLVEIPLATPSETSKKETAEKVSA